jgi:hypothetical protein
MSFAVNESATITKEQWDKLRPTSQNTGEWVDGIPFVGCKCLATRGANSRRFEIVYRGRTKKGEHIIEYDTGHVSSITDDKINFYPIRTPEETEREAIVRDLTKTIEPILGVAENAQMIYNAGYRKIKELSDEDIDEMFQASYLGSIHDHLRLLKIDAAKQARDYMLGKEKS